MSLAATEMALRPNRYRSPRSLVESDHSREAQDNVQPESRFNGMKPAGADAIILKNKILQPM